MLPGVNVSLYMNLSVSQVSQDTVQGALVKGVAQAFNVTMDNVTVTGVSNSSGGSLGGGRLLQQTTSGAAVSLQATFPNLASRSAIVNAIMANTSAFLAAVMGTAVAADTSGTLLRVAASAYVMQLWTDMAVVSATAAPSPSTSGLSASWLVGLTAAFAVLATLIVGKSVAAAILGFHERKKCAANGVDGGDDDGAEPQVSLLVQSSTPITSSAASSETAATEQGARLSSAESTMMSPNGSAAHASTLAPSEAGSRLRSSVRQPQSRESLHRSSRNQLRAVVSSADVAIATTPASPPPARTLEHMVAEGDTPRHATSAAEVCASDYSHPPSGSAALRPVSLRGHPRTAPSPLRDAYDKCELERRVALLRESYGVLSWIPEAERNHLVLDLPQQQTDRALQRAGRGASRLANARAGVTSRRAVIGPEAAILVVDGSTLRPAVEFDHAIWPQGMRASRMMYA